MTDIQAKDATLVRMAPAKAVRQMRRLMNEIPQTLSNEMIICDRLERIHDELAKSLSMDTWDELWKKGDPRPFTND
jgi:hypothetical protein